MVIMFWPDWHVKMYGGIYWLVSWQGGWIWTEESQGDPVYWICVWIFHVFWFRVQELETHTHMRLPESNQMTREPTLVLLEMVHLHHWIMCIKDIYVAPHCPHAEVNLSRVLGARWFICPHQLPTGCSWPLGFVTSMKNVPVNDNNQTK